MKNRDFTYKGIDFHLNNNEYHNEFEGKYTLLFFHQGYEKWMRITTCDSKKEAMEYVRESFVYR